MLQVRLTDSAGMAGELSDASDLSLLRTGTAVIGPTAAGSGGDARGTVPPARVLVLGAGVAGLQAITTARRLGAVVHAYDIRAAAKEQDVRERFAG